MNLEYKKEFINFFIKYFLKFYSKDDLKNLKMITKSLFFSLIPLHDNENCNKFFEMINSEFLN